jgi:hypothetical protein
MRLITCLSGSLFPNYPEDTNARAYSGHYVVPRAFRRWFASHLNSILETVSEEQSGYAPCAFGFDRFSRMFHFSVAAPTTAGFGDVLPLTTSVRWLWCHLRAADFEDYLHLGITFQCFIRNRLLFSLSTCVGKGVFCSRNLIF